jgi:hypothetical protein
MGDFIFWDYVGKKLAGETYGDLILTISYEDKDMFQIYSYIKPTIRIYDNREKINGKKFPEKPYEEARDYMTKILNKANKMDYISETKMLYILYEFEKFIESNKKYSSNIKGDGGWEVWVGTYNKNQEKDYKLFKKLGPNKYNAMKDLEKALGV